MGRGSVGGSEEHDGLPPAVYMRPDSKWRPVSDINAGVVRRDVTWPSTCSLDEYHIGNHP